MKKILFIVLIFLCTCIVFSQGLQNRLFSFNTDKSSYFYENDLYRIVGTPIAKDDYCEFTNSDLCIDKDGWQYLNKDLSIYRYRIWDEDNNIILDTYNYPYIILGANYICCFSRAFNNNSFLKKISESDEMYFLDDNFYEEREKNIIGSIEKLKFSHETEQPFFMQPATSFTDGRIKNIKASSFYSEPTTAGLIKYKSSNLLYLFMNPYNYGKYTFYRGTYWVPGKQLNSSGIGEYLSIEFGQPEEGIVILNGYADPAKRHLYRANNRIKTATVQSLDANNYFEFDYLFEDYVTFSEIKFPEETNKVKIIIKEIYKGEKWDDTVVTAVLPIYNNIR